MSEENILIIGAGAAGLMAARQLLKAGNKVVILEAMDRVGGRVHDIKAPGLSVPIMLGAEFIHGNLPVTFSLLKEAGIKYDVVKGINYRSHKGNFKEQEGFLHNWPAFMQKLMEVKKDMSLADFLDLYFKEDEFLELRNSVVSFVQGYDAADPEKVSVLSLRREWQQEEEEQYRISGGYSSLIRFLEEECIKNGALILLKKVVSHFNWSEGFAEAVTSEGERFTGKKAIITLPLGVLQIKNGGPGFVNFTPPLPIRMGAVRSMGFGSVIKVVIHFSDIFWQENINRGAGFVFSEERIPTWWTQLPDESPVLTGWLAGPSAETFSGQPEEELTDIALNSVASIFNITYEEIKAGIIKVYLFDWASHPFSRGAYAYTTLAEPDAPGILGKPVEDVLYFAGEATYEGPHGGTVEAALVSGLEVAEKVLTA